jgi:hypothetical protein
MVKDFLIMPYMAGDNPMNLTLLFDNIIHLSRYKASYYFRYWYVIYNILHTNISFLISS